MPTAGAAYVDHRHQTLRGSILTLSPRSTKYWRLKKAHTLPSDGNSASPADESSASTSDKPKKGGKATSATATPAKKRKLDEVDEAARAKVKAESSPSP